MPSRVYMNRRAGEKRVHIEIEDWELKPLLAELGSVPWEKRTGVGDILRRILAESAAELGIEVPS